MTDYQTLRIEAALAEKIKRPENATFMSIMAALSKKIEISELEFAINNLKVIDKEERYVKVREDSFPIILSAAKFFRELLIKYEDKKIS